jgi:hypothetical protein
MLLADSPFPICKSLPAKARFASIGALATWLRLRFVNHAVAQPHLPSKSTIPFIF